MNLIYTPMSERCKQIQEPQDNLSWELEREKTNTINSGHQVLHALCSYVPTSWTKLAKYLHSIYSFDWWYITFLVW